jgi:hypothetical protein
LVLPQPVPVNVPTTNPVLNSMKISSTTGVSMNSNIKLSMAGVYSLPPGQIIDNQNLPVKNGMPVFTQMSTVQMKNMFAYINEGGTENTDSSSLHSDKLIIDFEPVSVNPLSPPLVQRSNRDVQTKKMSMLFL